MTKEQRVPKIRRLSKLAFKCGDWATILGVQVIQPSNLRVPRICFKVKFDDDVEDFWPVEDASAEYEFSPSIKDEL